MKFGHLGFRLTENGMPSLPFCHFAMPHTYKYERHLQLLLQPLAPAAKIAPRKKRFKNFRKNLRTKIFSEKKRFLGFQKSLNLHTQNRQECWSNFLAWLTLWETPSMSTRPISIGNSSSRTSTSLGSNHSSQFIFILRLFSVWLPRKS